MDDLVSRQAAINKAKERLIETALNNVGIKQNVDEVLVDVAEERLENWIDEVPSAQPEQRWIPVTERLPEDMTNVLVTIHTKYKGYKVRSSYYSHDYFHNDNGDCWKVGEAPLLAWMHQPEPYKEGKNEKPV